MHPAIRIQQCMGRSPHDPAPSVLRLIAETAWVDNGVPQSVTVGVGEPSILTSTPQITLDAWKAPFEAAALGVSITEVAGYDVLPPALEVKSGARLIGIFSLTSNPIMRRISRIEATYCAVKELRRQALAASRSATTVSVP